MSPLFDPADCAAEFEFGRLLRRMRRGPDGRGMAGSECTTCHGPENPPSNYGLHVPPGVNEGWPANEN